MIMQAECSAQAESLAAEVAAREAELASAQQEQATSLAKQDALAREILETEKRLQVGHPHLLVRSISCSQSNSLRQNMKCITAACCSLAPTARSQKSFKGVSNCQQ